MIIRIATEGQYELKGEALQKLDDIDNDILAAIEKENAAQFRQALEQVLNLVRAQGIRLPDTVLKESDLILPPPDTSLEQARSLFADYPHHLL